MKLVWNLYRAVFFLLLLAAWLSPIFLWAWIGSKVFPRIDGQSLMAVTFVPMLLTYWAVAHWGAPLVERIDDMMTRLLKPPR